MKKANLISLGVVLSSVFTVPAYARIDNAVTNLATQRGLASSVPRAVAKAAQESVFEVVISKPTDAPGVTYEKELPSELMSYKEKNDKYNSIGTAFEVEGGLLVSASHVINLHGPGHEYLIRDSKGKLYKIDKIYGYSITQDFVVFSLKGKRTGKGLKVDRNPELNEDVFAVGNAHGEGVIIRDGLFVSKTKEPQSGNWDYLRFSAPASPGNSGGPLVDAQGRVIGIILMKTEAENLNFALPISEALYPKHPGRVEAGLNQKIFNAPDRFALSSFSVSFKMPISYSVFRKKLLDIMKNQRDVSMQHFKNENQQQMFPFGDKSAAAVEDTHKFQLREEIAAELNGKWGLYSVDEKSLAFGTLDNGVSFDSGKVGPIKIIRTALPKSLSLSDYLKDHSHLSKTLAKSLEASVKVGPMSVAVTSLGAPLSEEFHTDRFGRVWVIHVFKLPGSNDLVVSASLPLPGGLTTKVMVMSCDEVLYGLQEFKFLADFSFIDYRGTFNQWADYLSLTDHFKPDFVKKGVVQFVPDELRMAGGSLCLGFKRSKLKHPESDEVALTMGLKVKGPVQSYQPYVVGFYSPVDGGYAAAIVGIAHQPTSEAESKVSIFNQFAGSDLMETGPFEKDGHSHFVELIGKARSSSKEERSKLASIKFIAVRAPGKVSLNSLKDLAQLMGSFILN